MIAHVLPQAMLWRLAAAAEVFVLSAALGSLAKVAGLPVWLGPLAVVTGVWMTSDVGW